DPGKRVRTGSAGSRTKPRPRPRAGRFLATEPDPVMQAKRALVPEFHVDRLEPEARPVGRSRNMADCKSRCIPRHRLLQRESAFQRARLFRCPGSDTAVARP